MRDMSSSSRADGTPGWRRYTEKVPTVPPSAATMGVDQAARRPAWRAASRRNSHIASVSMSAAVICRARYTAAEHEPKRIPIGAWSMAATNSRGRLGAVPKRKACAAMSSTLMAQKLWTITRSITSQMASNTDDKGALAAIFSNTRRSPAAIAAAR